ncbi:uncharacterized protein LOC127008557 [Eriocheir sinensis]|uniref:uncharacterized protein LOC127008557 n=1 Tax=Eriocheir sinensis TaxID=95602 RepID=UPI0021C6B1AD|nr:uncharacterized protein LOC127008557 [Eriocheir sinensis]
MTSNLGYATFLLLAAWYGCPSHCQMLRRPSPASEFLLRPSNTTVPEGEQTILKCLVDSQVHACRWYFLELQLDFFSKDASPMQVKDFKPAHNRDCSIRIKKVRKIQEGQWLCQAFKFHSSEILMTEPVVLRVITRSESASWAPPSDFPPVTTPRQSRHNDEKETAQEVSFEFAPEDYIRNTKLNESAMLNCRVNKPMESCTWITPNGSSLNVSQDEVQFNKPKKFTGDYKLKGDLKAGQCSLHVGTVQHQDEGDWRCVVQVVGRNENYQGPLLHLHITDLPFPFNHSHDGEPLMAPTEESSSVLVITLVLTSTILLILVVLLFSCLYRRVAAVSDDSHKILQASPQSSLNRLPHKAFPTTDLTAASVLAVDSVKSSPAKCVDLDQYNQYLDMTGSDNISGSYVMMPPSSLRSSMSSRTTLSTLSTLPVGRSRSASSSTVLSRASPGPGNLMDNPSYDPSDAPARPDNLYYADHIYEEIKDKHEELTKMDKIPEVTTPTYTNTLQDYEGYLVPKNNTSSEKITAHPVNDSPNALSLHTLPRPKAESPAVSPGTEQAPPYSRVGQCGLVPASPTPEAVPSPGPGYSRVGSGNLNGENILTDPMEGYDVIRSSPRPVPLPLNIPVSSEAYTNGLTGITV